MVAFWLLRLFQTAALFVDLFEFLPKVDLGISLTLSLALLAIFGCLPEGAGHLLRFIALLTNLVLRHSSH